MGVAKQTSVDTKKPYNQEEIPPNTKKTDQEKTKGLPAHRTGTMSNQKDQI